MTTRSMTREARWLTLAGLLVSFHRLAMGFYLSDSEVEGVLAAGLIVLGGLAALVLTGAQMLLASTLAKVRDPLLEIAWVVLLVCAVLVMSASTLASMHGASLAEVIAEDWLRAKVPAVVLAVGLSLAIEVALASIRRASTLLARAENDPDALDLDEHELAELEVQRELARHRDEPPVEMPIDIADSESEPPINTNDDESPPPISFVRSCPWCNWSTTRPTKIQAINSLKAHQRYCTARPGGADDS